MFHKSFQGLGPKTTSCWKYKFEQEMFTTNEGERKQTQGKTLAKAMAVQPNANETLMTMEATMLHTFESAQIKD